MPEITPIDQSTYLFFTGGGSDKEYHAHLREKRQWGVSQGWVVDYANGKRGHVGQSKPKTPNPLPYEAAKKVYDDMVKSKKKDGYTEAESGVRFTNTDSDRQFSGHVQQLSVPITKDDVERLLDDPNWGAQQKANGERRTVVVKDGEVRGINKLGLYVNIPETWCVEFRELGNCKMDGEQIGDQFYAFDLLATDRSESIEHLAFRYRFNRLQDTLLGLSEVTPSLHILDLANDDESKRELLKRMESMRHEGVVFKRLDAPYKPGRDENSLKFKFKETSTCQVLAVNQKRSVQIGLLDDDGQMVKVGNVTIPAGNEIPGAGDLIEVEYLYYNGIGGSFEQPVFLGVRNDILPAEAVLSQVKRFKPDFDADAEQEDSIIESDAPGN